MRLGSGTGWIGAPLLSIGSHRLLGFAFASADLLLEITSEGLIAFALGASEAISGQARARADRQALARVHRPRRPADAGSRLRGAGSRPARRAAGRAPGQRGRPAARRQLLRLPHARERRRPVLRPVARRPRGRAAAAELPDRKQFEEPHRDPAADRPSPPAPSWSWPSSSSPA